MWEKQDCGSNDRKRSLRAEIRGKLASVEADYRKEADVSILHRLMALYRAHTVDGLVAYMAIQHEVDVRMLIQNALDASIPVWLPRFDSASGVYDLVRIHDLSTDLACGRYGILEPITTLPGTRLPLLTTLNVFWLIPGIAFDLAGHRLGRGGGYYDRMLQGAGGVKVGVAYDCQVVDTIPSEEHDVSMTYVATEKRLIG